MLSILHFLLLIGLSMCRERLMQIMNSTSYCYDSAIFSCVNEDRSYVIWELKNEEEGMFYTGSFTAFLPISSTTITTLRLSNITVEITFRNSSFMATTLTTTNISLLVPVTVVCDRGTREELEYNSASDFLPFSFELLQTSNNIALFWNLTWEVYYIKELSPSDDTIRTTSISNISSLPYLIHNNTTKINISICFKDLKELTIEPGVLLEANNRHLENKYNILDSNTWLFSCKRSKLSLNSTCNRINSWDSVPHVETTENYYGSGLLNNTQIDFTQSNSLIVLISSVISVGILLLVISIIFISIAIVKCYHIQKTSSSHLAEEEVDIYEQLSDWHHNIAKPNPSSRFQQEVVNSFFKVNNPNVTYSSLHRGKLSVPSNEEYATINVNNTPKTNRVKNLDYAEVYSRNHCGRVTTENPIVKYSNVKSGPEKADESLNLCALVAKLGEISESFISFGSVAGISPASLKAIVAKSSSPHDSMAEICDLWLQKCKQEQTPPTWHAIAEILEIIGHNKLSKDILQIYVTGNIPRALEVVATPEKIGMVSSSSISADISESQLISIEKEKEFHGTEIDGISLSDEPPPIPSYNPSGSVDMFPTEDPPPPLYEEVQVDALRPCTFESQQQSGQEMTTFTVL